MNLSLQIDSSGKAEVSWTKVEAIFYITKLQSLGFVLVIDSAVILLDLFQNNAKLGKQPNFTKLGYSDSGRYEWTVTVGHITRTASFDLTVEGKGFEEKSYAGRENWYHSVSYLKLVKVCSQQAVCEV